MGKYTAHPSAENCHDGRGDRQEKPSHPVVEQEGVLGRGVGTEGEAPQVRVGRLPPTCCRRHHCRDSIVGVSVIGGGDAVVVTVVVWW